MRMNMIFEPTVKSFLIQTISSPLRGKRLECMNAMFERIGEFNEVMLTEHDVTDPAAAHAAAAAAAFPNATQKRPSRRCLAACVDQLNEVNIEYVAFFHSPSYEPIVARFHISKSTEGME